MKRIHAPLTAIVYQILVAQGDHVTAGTEIMILEAMKMEIPVEAESSGTVAQVLVQEGDSVQEGEPLIELNEDV
jgi:acetyl-CoA carboxylase biotin carboxyl carrier protein